MNKFYLVFFTLAVLLSGCETEKQASWELFSPDKNIKFSIYESATKQLLYDVKIKLDNEFVTVIDISPLGIERKDEQFITDLTFISESEITVIDESYVMVSGKQSSIKNYANEIILSFSNEKNSIIDFELRAYNDGIAFRYSFPENQDIKTVVNEATGFKIPMGGKAWIAPYDTVSWYAPAYETHYEEAIPVGTTSPNKNGWGFPALFEVNNCWVLLSEAGLDETYCAMHLQAKAENGLYTMRFPEKGEAEGIGEQFPSATLPWATPWRLAIIGDDLGDIVESNMVSNLSDASTITDTDWIIPGKSSWSWWSDNDSPSDYNKLVSFVDLAKEFNWEYTLVDAAWDSMKYGNIKQLVEYSNSQDVGVWIWYNSGGPHSTFPAYPRDLMHIDSVRQKEFAKIASWGVKGVKVDFFQTDKQDFIKLHMDILRDAAKYKILVNFHGCTLPRGWSRTYPHLLAMEAVKGEEVYRFGDYFPKKAPIHNSILPFTRNVVGQMDYTPVGFTDRKYPHLTTWAHEVALPVVFEVGVVSMADGVDAYMQLPTFVKDFLTEVPAAWDETKYIAGYPGEYVIIARRKGDTWYIGGLNSINEPKTFEFSLPFLSDNAAAMNLIIDGKNSKSFSHQSETCNNKSIIKVNLLPYGGFSGVVSN